KEPKGQAYKNNLLKLWNISVIYPNSQTQLAVALQVDRLLCSNMGAFHCIYPCFRKMIFKWRLLVTYKKKLTPVNNATCLSTYSGYS
ncbi:MAG: hypothetical protein ACKOXP_06320, partial [Flavobacteriales bacterium]